MARELSRLDDLLVSRGLCRDVREARAAIVAGEVVVGEHRAEHAGMRLAPDAELRLKSGRRGARGGFVGRGGMKLDGALETLSVSVAGENCADLGCSTGGFTDCLLKHGASRVAAVDVGRADFDWSLRSDERVALFERTDVRGLDVKRVGGPFDLVVCDLSFIRLASVLPDISRLLGVPAFDADDSGSSFCSAPVCGAPSSDVSAGDAAEGATAAGELVALVKPQFELPHALVGRGGVVDDAALHVRALSTLDGELRAAGFAVLGWCHSPVRGAKGNIEFFVHARSGSPRRRPSAAPESGSPSFGPSFFAADDIERVVAGAHAALLPA